jgi:membrane associated rhomboid family serine protease
LTVPYPEYGVRGDVQEAAGSIVVIATANRQEQFSQSGRRNCDLSLVRSPKIRGLATNRPAMKLFPNDRRERGETAVPLRARWRARWRTLAKVLGGLLVLMWLLEIVDYAAFNHKLDSWGIAPRQAWGLLGIPLAPLLHGSLEHIAANTIPLLVLGGLVLWGSVRRFAVVSLTIVLISGLAVWLLGRGGRTHLGASGLVFGYFGYLIMRFYFDRSLGSLFAAALATLLYGGLLWGLLPMDSHVSWESHLFGFAGGVAAAWIWRAASPQAREKNI